MSKKKRRTSYIKYSYDDTFVDPLEKAEEYRVERMLKEGLVKSVYATKTIKAGNQFEVEIYPEFTKKEADVAKLVKTNKAQKNLNSKNARKRLERLINNNFTDGDLWITMTYSPENLPQNIEEAQKNMQNFIGRINYRRKKEGLEKAKYIYVTEYNEKKKVRCHHHLIMDCGLDMDTVEKLWKKGKRNNVRRVSGDENGLSGLAQYLTKDPAGRKRWSSSTNLKKPKESKSYSTFKASHVKKIVEGRTSIKEIVEKKYSKMIYTYEEIKYNKFNGKFYIYVRMRERRGHGESDIAKHDRAVSTRRKIE